MMNTVFKNSIAFLIIALSVPAYSFGQVPQVAGSRDTANSGTPFMMQNNADLERSKKRTLEGGNDAGKEMSLTSLKAQMTKNPAPAFSLYDTDGKLVTLSSLKGKVIVLDFWATWCVPCLASFPAMQQVSEKYKADKEVVFLYVNTLERDKDVKSWIAKFKKEHHYSFRVLLDKNVQVVMAYKSTGLPTKVIIDKNGMIRFTTAGFSGDSYLVKELTSMIELTKNAQQKK